ncbi:Polysialic acid transport protein KpsM [Pseudovibrio axinellae]|uniref:Transport permease protein n=1 Tax=Pseudovibrio axinellae TaxID=989403 RepID=A0A165W8J3_9HYPH|nr:ABC transporter permease [Pseudovibrio axinellae]KZL16189.1 Polysialic acid transport protein KpsM [Pseudovibrio axinellae]SER76320.1 capsular polysaccharide transport system permease protein [Pseudovibrio axinellae]
MEGVITTQARVIGALVLRETRTAFGDTQLGYLWAIVNPALSTLVLVMIFSAIGRSPAFGTSFALFFATGVLTFQTYSRLSGSLMTAINSSRGLLSYPLVHEADLLISKYILITLTYLMIIIVFFTLIIWWDNAALPVRPEECASAFLAVSLLGLGAGATNAVLLRLWPTWKQIDGIISRPLFFLSGIFYVPSDFPSHIVKILAWNPILHGVEWFREGYYGNYDSVVLSKPYLLTCAIILLLVGFYGERLYRKKSH